MATLNSYVSFLAPFDVKVEKREVMYSIIRLYGWSEFSGQCLNNLAEGLTSDTV